MKKTKKALVTLAIMGMAATLVPFNVLATTGVTTDRLGGTDRFQTADNVADQFGTADTAILAPAANANLVDALAAAPLAGKTSPILLTDKNSLTQATQAELGKLGIKKVYVVGAIDQTVVDQVRALGITAIPLKGTDRIGTAVKIAAQLINPRGSFVVGFNALADALSVASYAAANNYSILVANPDGSLPASEVAYKGAKVYTVGGKSLVADIAGATRLAGADRYATNKVVLDTLGYTYNKAYLANGTDEHLVDSLVASSLAAFAGAPIVLTDPGTGGDATATSIGTKLLDNAVVIALGGDTIVLDGTLQKVINAVPATIDPQIAIVKAATDAVVAYEGAPVVTSADVTAAEALEATATTKAGLVTNAITENALTSRITTKKTAVNAAKASIAAAVVVSAATDAVVAYEGAPVVTSADVTAAEALEATASANVNLVTDTTTKAGLTARITNKKTAVDAVKQTLAAAALLVKVTAEVDQYTALSKGDLSTQVLINAAKNAGAQARVDLAGIDGDAYWTLLSNIQKADAIVNPLGDNEKPVIALNGGSPITVKLGDTFTDPGTTVTDNVDKGLVAGVTGLVDTTIEGTYILTYNVSDFAGNAAIAVTRNVVVSAVVANPDAAAAKTVQDAITALPATITLTNKDAVVAARTAYTGLTATQQALVTNLTTLTTAEATIVTLEAAGNLTIVGTPSANLVLGTLSVTVSDATKVSKVLVNGVQVTVTPLGNDYTIPINDTTDYVVFVATDGTNVIAQGVAAASTLTIVGTPSANPVLGTLSVTVSDATKVSKVLVNGVQVTVTPLGNDYTIPINDTTDYVVFVATDGTNVIAQGVAPALTGSVGTYNGLFGFIAINVSDSSLVKSVTVNGVNYVIGAPAQAGIAASIVNGTTLKVTGLQANPTTIVLVSTSDLLVPLR